MGALFLGPQARSPAKVAIEELLRQRLQARTPCGPRRARPLAQVELLKGTDFALDDYCTAGHIHSNFKEVR